MVQSDGTGGKRKRLGLVLGGKQDKIKKPQRMILLYDRLFAGQMIYPPDIAQELGVDLRSIQRDLADLRATYLPIETLEIDNKLYYKVNLADQKMQIAFGPLDLMVIILALRIMEQYEGTGLTGNIAGIAEKISNRVTQAVARRSKDVSRKFCTYSFLPRNYENKQDAVDDILTGLLDQKKITLRYRSLAGGTKTHTVCPYCLVPYKTGLYLVGQIESKHAHHEPTVFALERIQACDCTKESFQLPDGWNPADFLSERGGILPGKRERVEIAFDASLHEYLKNLRWPEGVKLAKPKGERSTLLLKGEVVVNDELVSWIVGFGAKATVIQPPSLVDWVREHLRDTLKHYENL